MNYLNDTLKQKVNKPQHTTKTIYQLGFPCGQSTAQPATAAVRLDRNEARNPQLYIVPSVSTNNNARHSNTYQLDRQLD
jgi:hypothetical protein